MLLWRQIPYPRRQYSVLLIYSMLYLMKDCHAIYIHVSCGVPQSMNLGLLLFLIYINDRPNCLSTASPIMFADDTNVSLASCTLFELENVLNRELQNLNIWLRVNKVVDQNES